MAKFQPFPEPKEIYLRESVTVHQRYRVVIHDCEIDSAKEKAELLSENYACDLETFVAYVNNETGESLGEIVGERKFYPCKQATVN